jgi:hypothetical protein
MLNAASSHVIGSSITAQGTVNPGETSCNVLFMAPVGHGNFTVGYNKDPDRNWTQLPPGMNATVVLPVHLRITDPTGQTLLEQDIVTPASFPINFDTRGEYKVYLTNNGSEQSAIPIGTKFELNNPQNREADKYSLSLSLIAVGAVCTIAGLALNLVSKKLGKTHSKSVKQTGVKP